MDKAVHTVVAQRNSQFEPAGYKEFGRFSAIAGQYPPDKRKKHPCFEYSTFCKSAI